MKSPLAKLRRALGKANALPDDVAAVITDLQARLGDAERELIRVSPQVAALEERLEDLRRRVESPEAPGDLGEARTVLEDVRAEHARVRARITAATVFEERIRVLEERLGVDSRTGRDR